ncbi:FAA hydrolase [Xylariaceae sp. FL0016]|nr:FAA hydrolase [Xylariaceae sp. FL0016]
MLASSAVPVHVYLIVHNICLQLLVAGINSEQEVNQAAMKYQRVNHQVSSLDGSGGSLSSLASPASMLLRVLEDNPPDRDDPRKRALPFQPRSYRDFMLFERHYYGAALGMTEMYRPAANLVGRLFSALTSLDFPFFKPHALWYKQPIFYQSNHLAFYSDGASIQYPAYCEYLDVELELGIILGKPLFNASPEEATSAIAGFCVFNDFSARNVQMEEMASGFGPQHSKAFANSISSAVVSADEILPHIDRLKGRIIINEEVVQEPSIDKWQFSVGEAIAHLSKSTQLYPGEFFGSGTITLGAGIENSAFQLRVGDVVRLEIDGIGSVTNTIVAEE